MSVFSPPEYLSPSSIRTFLDCPQKFKISRFDGIKEPPAWPLHLGSFTHEVLEELYKLPPDERTTESLKALAARMWTENEWESKVLALEEPKGDIRQFKVEAFTNMTNLWHLEDPAETELDEMELEVDVEVDGVRMRGFIDRLVITDDQSAIISDYKTGKIPNPKFKSEDEKYFQLLAYALMLEALDGIPTESVELLYLTQKERHRLEVTPAKLAIATGTIVETKELLDQSCATEQFETKVSKLCDWCHYKKIGVCPAHK